MITRSVLLLFLITVVLPGQRRMDPKNTYVQVISVVPHTGTVTRNYWAYPQISDDGRWAPVEYVACDPAPFQQILNDKTIKTSLEGKDKKSDVEAKLKKHKKDSHLTGFGLAADGRASW